MTIAALVAHGATPSALPTPAAVATRASGLRGLLDRHPLEAHEALRRCFADWPHHADARGLGHAAPPRLRLPPSAGASGPTSRRGAPAGRQGC